MDWLVPGLEFDGYKLERRLGEGGMGVVHLARDTLLERSIAIKFITTEADAAARQRFSLEARAVARLAHPNVVAIHRIGDLRGIPYLVSEYVPGEPMDEIEVPIQWRRVLATGLELAGALAMAHRRGVLHRDIKPANVILSDDGTAKLLDFGIAKLLTGEEPEIPVTATKMPEAGLDLDQATATVPLHEELGSSTAQGITRSGVALGTPAYMPPEIWLGQEATFASDVYSFGALLFYLCTGRPPFKEGTIEELARSVTTRGAPDVQSLAPDVPPNLASVIDRCLAKDPTARFEDGEALRLALARLSLDRRTDLLPEGNPYRGLLAFDQEHRNLFFGRDSEIRMILDRLAAEPFVLVVGDSGVGKSSLVRAGILPRVGDWLGPDRTWQIVSVIPGRHPMAALVTAVSPLVGKDERETEQTLRDDPAELGRLLRSRLGPNSGVVIFVDQLEELLTFADPSEVPAVAEVFHWLAVLTPGVRLVATIRGDFLGRLANLDAFGDDLTRRIYFLRPLSEERIRDAIVSPARAKGVRFETDQMVDELSRAAAQSPGALPLLQFALARLWEADRDDPDVIPLAALEKLGGVEGALSSHADNVIERMLSSSREAARKILLELVGTDGTRTRKTRTELAVAGDSAAETALDEMVRGRILTAGESDGEPSYSVAHEALLRSWPTLAGWLNRSEENRRARDRIRRATESWERLGRGREGLFGKGQLREIDFVVQADMGPRERAFLTRSRRALTARRVLRATAVLAIPVLAALIYGGILAEHRWNVRREIESKVAATMDALKAARDIGARARDLRTEALRLFDDRQTEEAERLWREHRGKALEYESALAKSSQELETVLLLDPERTETRMALGRVLMDRALAAERRGDEDATRELVLRMGIYDADGSLQKQWNALGRVMVRGLPGETRGSLARVRPMPDGHFDIVDAGEISASLGGQTLAPGSYIATFSDENRVTLKLPFRLERGERLDLPVEMISPERVPEGFVYVPGGDVFFGSGAADGQRRDFFHTVPIHRRKVAPFFISQLETTYAEWLEYLEALDEEERAQRKPRVQAGGFQGSLDLLRVDEASWQITLMPASERYVARSGEKITYPGRNRRAVQDWMRFPVSGITARDAEAYAAWLLETGRVQGARLCSELEWERAAKGADQREFPHGEALDKDDANFDDTYDKDPRAMGPDEVGSHPRSASPFGIEDMAGNAWEWTRSVMEEGFVARGGSYYYGKNTSRTTERAVTEPSFRDASVGVRICADIAR